MTLNTPPLSISAKNLAFSYPEALETPVLESISLEIVAGQMVAFIGPSGAGKSTLAGLVLGLLEPTHGSVIINGQTPRAFVEHNPGKVSLVQQASSLIGGSIAENIALGVPTSEINSDDLAHAIEGAELSEWVASLPNGVNTEVDTGTISGGQLQRIGLARALYTRPSLLVLDEPTSSLDADTESRVAASLKKLHGQVTQIVIAHRLTTIEDADVVYLIEGGKIAAQGPFAELRTTSPTVARQVELLTFKN